MDLTKFNKFIGKECVLTKIGSKRPNSYVGKGHSETGEMELFEYPETDTLPAQTGIIVYGIGFSFLRTSPVVKVVDETDSSLVFETEGGIYRLELQ